MNKHTITQPWYLRKAAQFIIGLAILGFVAFDVIDQATADAAMQSVQNNIIPLIGAALNIFAGTKTHAGSDSKLTEADVAAARREGLAEAAGGMAETLARTVGERVDQYFNPVPKATETDAGEGSGLPVYTGPTTT